MNILKYFILVVSLSTITSCNHPIFFGGKTSSDMNKQISDPNIFTCQLVEKEFVNKAGKTTGLQEFYLRCSIQDYFIKLCESEVQKEDLVPFLNKGIKVRATVIDGEWDICPDADQELQSRIGKYVVIHEILD